MCAELDVVNVKVDDGDSYVVLRMTWAQQNAYRHGRFTPRYMPGRSEDFMVDADGNGIEIFDVTDQSF
jgi:hypothetical protein